MNMVKPAKAAKPAKKPVMQIYRLKGGKCG